MYLAMQEAIKNKHDFYLMINDDVVFFDRALEIMLSSYESVKGVCGVVGSTCGRDNTITYGGRNEKSVLLNPSKKLKKCILANWNCFLVSNEVISRVGIIDNYYVHGLGDFDYSLRMQAKKIPIYIASDYVGYCEGNTRKGTYHDKEVKRGTRVKLMFNRKNLPILSRGYYYCKNYSIRGIKLFFWPYIKCLYCIMRKRDF
ncbi:MAG: hypothetical protein R3Y24_15445 [Eubacteriales bacterium]